MPGWCRSTGRTRQELPQTTLWYTIAASFDAPTREIRARQLLRWRSPADVPLSGVPLHLYMNAFSHTRTTWMEGGTAIRDFDVDQVLRRDPDPWGFIELQSLTQCDDPQAAARWVREPGRGAPRGEPATLHYIQPDDGNTFPKLGMLDPPGKRGVAGLHWAARQFHGPTEFYAEFADFEVSLEVPADRVLITTGEGGPAQRVGFDEDHRSRPDRRGHRGCARTPRPGAAATTQATLALCTWATGPALQLSRPPRTHYGLPSRDGRRPSLRPHARQSSPPLPSRPTAPDTALPAAAITAQTLASRPPSILPTDRIRT